MNEQELFRMLGENFQKFFAEHNIKYVDYNHGWSEKEKKWYGWSHRAIYGYGIGSTVKKGSCGYTANNPEEMIDDYANFFADISQESADKHRAECKILEDRTGIRILHTPVKVPIIEDLNELESALDDSSDLPTEDIMGGYSIQKCGRGEWTAKTLEDAKQMALDFAEGVA